MIISFGMAIVSLGGLWLVSGGHRVGWAWGMGAQFVWGAYDIYIHQYGLLLMLPFYFLINFRGWSRNAVRQ